MNRRNILILSLCLNLLLVGGLAFARYRNATPDPSRNTGPIPSRSMRLPATPPPRDPEVIEVTASFQWAQLESDDYRVYIENLRGIECPEETIRDIVEADINDLFSARVTALVNSVTGRFWQLMLKQKEFQEMINEKVKELKTLKEERRELLKTLFGETDAVTLAAQQKQAQANLKAQFEFLSDEKIASLNEIEDRFLASGAALASQQLSAEERDPKQTELNSQKEQQLRTLLSDSEWAEYKLRSGPAANLRHELLDLEITESEVRALALAKSEPNGAEQIKALLGSDRYAAYQHTSEAEYQQTLQLTDRFDLPSETAVQVYQLRKEAEVQANRIRGDQNRPTSEREAILQAMRAETEKSIAGVLGSRVFKSYQKHSGDWLSRFSDTVQ